MSNAKITKAATHKIGDYALREKFPGYSARQDRTTIDPRYMIYPSQNVLIGTSGRIGTVKGYVLDGEASNVIDSGILSNYDFINYKSDYRNIRCGFLTNAGNDGKMQFRYVQSDGTVTWIDLITGLTTVRFSFCDYWDNTALIKYVLFVDGSNNIYKWNGAVTTVSSTTATTVTKEGTTTWAQEGFTSTGTITIAGVDYAYTGGTATTTLTGLTGVPVISAGTEVHQTPVITALSSMSGISSTFGPTVIGCGRLNQVYVGSSSSNVLYISKINDFTDYTFTTPTRIAGEGAQIILDDFPTGFVPQEVTANEGGENAYDMWVSEGLHRWGVIRMTLNGTNPNSEVSYEVVQHIRLKTGPLQGAFSERMITKAKNHITYFSNDNVANFIGYISYQYVPAITDFSYPIVEDMNVYDPTDGQAFFFKNYVFISFPRHGLIRMYNMTDQTRQPDSQYRAVENITDQPWFWEAPVTYPISGFYEVDGEIYGHSYTTSESYKLFTGGSFNGQNIGAVAAFAFDDFGDRTQTKGSDEIWVDGYINVNTELFTSVVGDLDSCSTTQISQINGNDNEIVCIPGGGYHSLGQVLLGSLPHGMINTPQFDIDDTQFITRSSFELPPYFHVVKTYPQVPSHLEQIIFSSNGVDLIWELISFGTNRRFTSEGNNSITQ